MPKPYTAEGALIFLVLIVTGVLVFISL